jgi:hypothetical protein
MNIDKIMHFFVKHNAVLIEAMTTLILVMAAYLAYRSYRQARQDQNVKFAPDMGNLEEMLKKVIERANLVQPPTTPATPESSGPTPAEQDQTAELIREITKLKTDLQGKQTEIEGLKVNAAGSGKPSVTPEEKQALEGQVQELKKKLEEFDIISQDIADLSFYKEENAKLQRELASRAAGAGQQTITPQPSQIEPSTEVKSSEEITFVQGSAPTEEPMTIVPGGAAVSEALSLAASTIVAQKAISVEDPPPGKAPAPTPAPAAVPPATDSTPISTEAQHAVENVLDDDIMKDFAAAVTEQKGSEPDFAKVSPASFSSSTEASKVPIVGMPEIDIPALGEDKPSAEKNADIDLGDLDLDKMATEVSALPSADGAADLNVLEGEIDPDKLAKESATMDTIKPEDKNLMGEFENFVKKDKS